MLSNDGNRNWSRLTDLHSRRTALRGLGAGLLVAGIGLGPGRAGTAAQAAPPAPALFEGETFVGPTSDPTTLVAVVLAAPDAAERDARAYLCDSAAIDAWLLGTLSGESLDLQSEAGARLEGQRTETGITGTATLPDGTALTFEAVPAVGVGGLYTVSVSPGYTWGGPSASGGQVRGLVSTRPLTARPEWEHDHYLAVGIVTLVEGEPVPLQLITEGYVEAAGRLIVLNGATAARGRAKGKGEQIMNWDADF